MVILYGNLHRIVSFRDKIGREGHFVKRALFLFTAESWGALPPVPVVHTSLLLVVPWCNGLSVGTHHKGVVSSNPACRNQKTIGEEAT